MEKFNFIFKALIIILASLVILTINSTSSWAEISNRFGVCIHPPMSEIDYDKIVEAGIKYIRTDIYWNHVESAKGQYDFVAPGYDALIANCQSHDINIILILNGSNALYETNKSVCTAAGRVAFSAFAKATAQRYAGKNILWEIWNEPNTTRFWDPQPSAKDYCLLVATAAKEIKEADKTAKVLGPAVCSFPLEWIEECFKNGLLEDIDVLSIHPYLTNQTNPETAIEYYKQLRRLIGFYAPYQKNIPIISSERGYSTYLGDESISPETQAEYLVRMFLIDIWQDLLVSIWYDWKNDGIDITNLEHNFGIVKSDLTPKPAFNVMKNFTTIFNDYNFIERVSLFNDNHFVMKFNNGTKDAYCFWTIADSSEITLKISAGSGSIVSIYGNSAKLKWGENGPSIVVNKQPQYLIVDGLLGIPKRLRIIQLPPYQQD